MNDKINIIAFTTSGSNKAARKAIIDLGARYVEEFDLITDADVDKTQFDRDVYDEANRLIDNHKRS